MACLARTFEEFPRFNSFRKGGRLVILDDLTIGVLFEREFEGESIPEGMGIKEANHKTFRQINDELREVQQHTGKHLGSASGIPWIRFIPDFLLKTFVRLAARNIAMKKRFGVTAVTAVGMFGSGPLWPVPLTSGTVTVAVGSIAKRPVPRSGQLEEREHLCLTISFNHDLIDGAPAARFVSRFAEWLSSGRELEEVIAHEKAESADEITDTQKRKEEE
ncbi:MAG: 2-oxo acid dehydrogenase subunit E2 [Fidelibacterota bacterium]|nr:MAG: 2-oxo acid dehydrogenase subunit E2 [Candidatus Neomarinimicrobiota bacterium]